MGPRCSLSDGVLVFEWGFRKAFRCQKLAWEVSTKLVTPTLRHATIRNIRRMAVSLFSDEPDISDSRNETTAAAESPNAPKGKIMRLSAIARFTGVTYLGLAVAGLVGFLIVRSKLFVPDNAETTLANLIEQESLARTGIAAYLSIVLFQALTAVGFFALFRRVNSFAAATLTTFGMVNAVAILVGTMFSATALHVALNPQFAPGGDAAATAQLLYKLEGAAWGVGSLFFGLWLIPMGWLVIKSRFFHGGIVLGWIQIVGGLGYIVSTYIVYLAPGYADAAQYLPFFATVGEFWIIVAMLIVGVRKCDHQPDSATAQVSQGRS